MTSRCALLFRWSVAEGKRRALLQVTSLPFHLFSFGLSCVCFDKSRPQLWAGFRPFFKQFEFLRQNSDLPNDALCNNTKGGGGVWQRVKGGHSYLQVPCLSLPFHLISFGKKESFFYLATGLKTNLFPYLCYKKDTAGGTFCFGSIEAN